MGNEPHGSCQTNKDLLKLAGSCSLDSNRQSLRGILRYPKVCSLESDLLVHVPEPAHMTDEPEAEPGRVPSEDSVDMTETKADDTITQEGSVDMTDEQLEDHFLKADELTQEDHLGTEP